MAIEIRNGRRATASIAPRIAIGMTLHKRTDDFEPQGGGANVSMGSNGVTAGAAAPTITTYRDRLVQRYNSPGGTTRGGRVYTFGSTGTLAALADLDPPEDAACLRYIAELAWSADTGAGNAANRAGFFISPQASGAGNAMLATGQAGAGFYKRAGALYFASRAIAGGALTEELAVAWPVVDPLAFVRCELRVLLPTTKRAAILEALVNGKRVARREWTGGTLPAVTGTNSMQVAIANHTEGTIVDLYAADLRLQVGPTP